MQLNIKFLSGYGTHSIKSIHNIPRHSNFQFVWRLIGCSAIAWRTNLLKNIANIIISIFCKFKLHGYGHSDRGKNFFLSYCDLSQKKRNKLKQAYECIPQQPHLSNQMHAFDDVAATSNYISSSQSVIGNPYTQPTNNVSNDDLIRFIGNLVNTMRISEMGSANNPMIGQQTTITAQNPGLLRQKRGKVPPTDYMCHLCFSKEHFISDCPMVSIWNLY